MQEHYFGGRGVQRLSRQQLREMIENMRQVPAIQDKSEKYHKSEAERAEQLLEKYLTINEETTDSNN